MTTSTEWRMQELKTEDASHEYGMIFGLPVSTVLTPVLTKINSKP